MLEISTWVFIVIVQVAIAACIAVLVLYAKLRKFQAGAEPSMADTEAEIARTKIRLQSSNQLKDMYFSLKAKYTALLKAQDTFEENINKIIHRDEQAKLADLFVAVKKENSQVSQELALIEKSLLSIAISKDEDRQAAERKATLVQETAEHIDHTVSKIQTLIQQQNTIVDQLSPVINKLPDEMEAKRVLLKTIAELEKTVAEMGTTMQAVCEQNQILQNQVESILGEHELAVRDLRKQVDVLSHELADQTKAYDQLEMKYRQTETELQKLYAKDLSKQAG